MDEIAQYWLVLKRRWLPAALVFALTTAGATVWTLKQTPIFQAKGQIILKKNNKTSSLLSSAAAMAGGGDLEGLSGSTPVNTQAEVLKSITTIKKSIATLRDGKYANRKEYKRLKKFGEKFELFNSQLKITSVKGTDILEVTFQDPSKELAKDVVDTIMAVYTQDDKDNQRREAEAAKAFIMKQQPLIDAEVRAAENDLRLFKEQYDIVDLPTESVKAVETITNLNKEITSASAQLAAETSKLDGLKNLFGGKDAQATIQSGLVSESPGLQKSLKELQEIEAKIAIEKTRFSDDDPSILNLKEKRAALVEILRSRFKQSLVGNEAFQGKVVEMQPSGIQGGLIADFAKSEAQRTSLQKQISALVFVVDAYKKRMTALPKLEQQQNALSRRVEISRNNYKTLLTKSQEIDIAQEQTLGNSKVQTEAELPQEAISPKVAQNIAIGGFLGLFLGAATAFMLDAADKRIKTAEEAKALLPGYPVLGQIPVFSNQKQLPKIGKGARTPGLLVLTGGGGIEAEAFRMLQTNLQFLNADNSLRALVVSSSQAGEGKSTVAANLALAVAELGKKVLLVDSDMRKPSQHMVWRQGNQQGLSNVLTGQCSEQSAINEVHPNVFLMTAGVIPPNPVILIDSAQMAESIERWTDSYDLVIIDAPPLTVAADAAMLGSQDAVAGLLFVLRPNVADKESVEYASEIIAQSKLKVLGMALNGVDLDKQHRYNSYYYTESPKNGNEANASKILSGSGSNRDRS